MDDKFLINFDMYLGIDHTVADRWDFTWRLLVGYVTLSIFYNLDKQELMSIQYSNDLKDVIDTYLNFL